MAAAGVQLVSEAGDADRSAHPLDPGLEGRPHVGRIVDPGGDLSQLTAGPQLVEHRWRDPEPRGESIHSGRRCPGRSQSLHEPVDTLLHLGIERRSDIRQADPPAIARQPAVIGHLFDHPTKLRVLEGQWHGSTRTRSFVG